MSTVQTIKDADGGDARLGRERVDLVIAENDHASNLPAFIGFFDR